MSSERAGTVPLVDLAAMDPDIRREIEAAVIGVLRRGDFIGGEAVQRFEENFARACGVPHACGVGNGTDALTLALRALGIGPGDEVIVPVMTFIATAEAVTHVGATIRFADVEEQRWTLDLAHLERAWSPKTRAVIPVHLYGHPADMEPILAFARQKKLFVIEDAAQAHGALHQGRPVGGLGDCAAFSFYPSKNLGACGDGGIVVSRNGELIEKVRKLSNHGRSEKYTHEMEGVNSRLDTLQAAVLEIKLRHLDRWNQARRAKAAFYQELLSRLPIGLPSIAEGVEPVWHLYVIRTPHRDQIRQALHKEGIQTGVHYPLPLHLQPAYRHLGLQPGSFPTAEKAAQEALSLPMYPELPSQDQQRIAQIMAKTLEVAARR